MDEYISPFQRHMKKARDEQAAKEKREALDLGKADVIQKSATDYNEFEVVVASVEKDQQKLEATPSGERDEIRKGLVERYMGHVKAYIDSEEVYANPVLVLMVMWLIDLGRIGEALKYGFVAVAQKQEMPKQFKRNLACFLADSVFDWAKAAYKNKESVKPFFYQVYGLLNEWPVNDAIKLKYHKFSGEMAYDSEDWKTAVLEFEKAESFEGGQLKAQVGTKLDKAKNKLEKQIKETADGTNREASSDAENTES